MNNDKLAEFLRDHKYNCENFNEEGNYDPNPYWLADEIVEFLNLHGVMQRSEPLPKQPVKTKWHKDDCTCSDCKLLDSIFGNGA